MIRIENKLGSCGGRIKIATPSFAEYEPDLLEIKNYADKYSSYNNFIIIGYGGSVTSFKAMLSCLPTSKRFEILDTVDPFELQRVKDSCGIDDTVVLAVSKSGTTISVIETLLFFSDYKAAVVTEKEDSPLGQIATKKGYDIIPHPAIGGRFSGRTATALLPAALAGYDIESINQGFNEAYSLCKNEDNPAENLAFGLFELEEKGITEVYMPIYSRRLLGFSELIVQLMHESVCKEGQGQSYLFAEGPEAQHHTNQRVFGGKKNQAILFISAEEESELKIEVPDDISEINLKHMKLSHVDGLSFFDALEFELKGSFDDCEAQSIPAAHLILEGIDEKSIGFLIGFFQFLAVYSATVRGVDPFNQPAVESSKIRTIELIKGD